MSLFQEYEKQQLWRDWPQYLNFIPLTSNDAVVDLGCSVGDMSRTFSKQVERVVGIDLNKEFVQFCQAKKTSNETFIQSDFLNVDYSSLGRVDGVWASFSLSYLTCPEEYLKQLHSIIAPDGWIALLDVSCFISGNLNKDSLYYERVRQFELVSYQLGLYDFNFAAKMQSMLQTAGFEITHVDNDVSDPELNFAGAASLDVIQGWSARLSRMQKLSELLGEKYSDFCVDLLSNLGSNSHEKRGSVRFVVAKKAISGVSR